MNNVLTVLMMNSEFLANDGVLREEGDRPS